MTAVTPEERGDLADDLLPFAARLACLVHGDGDQRDIQQTIARLSRDQRDALLVVLAALVDPDAPLDAALGFVTWDEHGQPAAPVRRAGTIRGLTYGKTWSHTNGWLSEDSIKWERQAAARALSAAGERLTDIGERLGVCDRTVARWLGLAS